MAARKPAEEDFKGRGVPTTPIRPKAISSMAKISPFDAAVDALGPLNGTVVVTQPETGRVLTIVNRSSRCRAAIGLAPPLKYRSRLLR
jgi:hypothetical protein